MTFFIESLTESHLDVLGEIGNIGTANAATSLSKIINKKVHMEIPAVKVVDFPDMMELTGGSEQIIVSALIEMQGEVEGNLFFVMLPEQAERFVLEMMDSDAFTFTEDLSHSVIKEISNILGGSYISALSDFTNLEIHMSVPSLAIDMAGAIFSNGLLDVADQSDQALIIDTTIEGRSGEMNPIDVFFFLIPQPDSYEKIFTALGVQYEK